MPKLYCMSDIHGCIDEFTTLLKKLNLQKEDTLILMGDYVDRGPDSKGIIDKIIELRKTNNIITLKGNHEVMMKSGFNKETEFYTLNWLHWGGEETINSYGISKEDFLEESFIIPKEVKDHLEFIDELLMYYETPTHIFVHASPGLGVPIESQSEANLIWRRPQPDDEEFNYNHISGKIIVSGHTAQSSGKPKFQSPKNILIDTGCFFTGTLTALDVYENIFITNN